MAEMDAAMVERQQAKQAKQAELLEQKAAIEATLARSDAELQTLSDAPLLSKEPLGKMIQGDVLEALYDPITDLRNKMIEQNVTEEVWNEVGNARDALAEGDAEPANEVLAKYA